MSNRSKRRGKQAKRKAEKLIRSGAPHYLNMDSDEWKSGKYFGYAIGYRMPIGSTPEDEIAYVVRQKELDLIFRPEHLLPKKKPQTEKAIIKVEPRPKKAKKMPKKKKFRLRVAEVHLELVGTEL